MDGRNVTGLNLDGLLGHILPKKIKVMAEYAILPNRLATCRVPMCTTCMFGKAKKKPWRTKAPQNRDQPTHTITKLGDCVSIAQLESSTLGLIGQLRSIPLLKSDTRSQQSSLIITAGWDTYISRNLLLPLKLWRLRMPFGATLPLMESAYSTIMPTMVTSLTTSFGKHMHGRIKLYSYVESTHIVRMV